MLFRLFLPVFSVAIVALSAAAYLKYAGQGYVYLLFTVVSNALLFLGFRKRAIFFDAFIGVFFWLGFWLKLSIRVVYTNGLFHVSVGAFDGSGPSFDRALLVASCGMLGLIMATLARERFFTYTDRPAECSRSGLFHFYRQHRKAVVFVFLVLVATVAVTNTYFGIYQRGAITQTALPYGLNGVYKWLLQFGLASVSALIIRFEIEITRNATWMAAFPALIEGFLSNVSLLSRGMILNISALFYGAYISLGAQKTKLNIAVVSISGLAFAVLFAASVFAVNFMRSPTFQESLSSVSSVRGAAGTLDVTEALVDVKGMTTPLFIDRWVGIEGVMAVSSSPKLGWDLWREAWREKYLETATSFYDMHLIESPYVNWDKTKYHYISLPGVIAFCFYPGSFLFLLACMVALGAAAAGIEVIVYKLGGANVILCSLLAQVVAYRFASFGYVPAQSYLLFGSLFLNVLIIFVADKLLSHSSLRTDRE